MIQFSYLPSTHPLISENRCNSRIRKVLLHNVVIVFLWNYMVSTSALSKCAYYGPLRSRTSVKKFFFVQIPPHAEVCPPQKSLKVSATRTSFIQNNEVSWHDVSMNSEVVWLTKCKPQINVHDVRNCSSPHIIYLRLTSVIPQKRC